MSTSSHQRGVAEREKEASRSVGLASDPQFYTALGASVLPAITELASALSAAASGVSGRTLDAAAVRANATDGAGGPSVQPDSGCDRCIDWEEHRRELYGETM